MELKFLALFFLVCLLGGFVMDLEFEGKLRILKGDAPYVPSPISLDKHESFIKGTVIK